MSYLCDLFFIFITFIMVNHIISRKKALLDIFLEYLGYNMDKEFEYQIAKVQS